MLLDFMKLQTLLKKGVKNIVVQGLPPTGCLPLAMALAPVDDRDDLGRVKTLKSKQSIVHPYCCLPKDGARSQETVP
jgi:hypothetical protein